MTRLICYLWYCNEGCGLSWFAKSWRGHGRAIPGVSGRGGQHAGQWSQQDHSDPPVYRGVRGIHLVLVDWGDDSVRHRIWGGSFWGCTWDNSLQLQAHFRKKVGVMESVHKCSLCETALGGTIWKKVIEIRLYCIDCQKVMFNLAQQIEGKPHVKKVQDVRLTPDFLNIILNAPTSPCEK